MADDEEFVSASSGELEQQLDGAPGPVADRNRGMMQHGCEHYRWMSMIMKFNAALVLLLCS